MSDFKRVKLDDKATDYVICSQCDDKKLIKYVSKNGTKILRNHQRQFHKSKEEDTKSKQMTMEAYTSKAVSRQEKSHIIDMAAICCAIDFRPFYMLEGIGFRKLVQSIIKLASVKGNIDAKDLLPTADAVHDHIISIHIKIKDAMVNEFKSIPVC